MEKAVQLLSRAAELDKAQRYSEALILYQEGIKIMMEALKGVPVEEDRQQLRTKIDKWMRRAEMVKGFAQHEKEVSVRHEQVSIRNGETGYDYPAVFERVFKGKPPTSVEVDDAYIRSKHQVTNFLRFCELMVRQRTVRTIRLQTGLDDHHSGQQQEDLQALSASLGQHNIDLGIAFSQTLHDREIRFDNGWVVKIGRGLDMYKSPGGRFAIGFCDMRLRHCHETTVDYYFKT